GAQFVAIDNQPAATTSLILSMTPLVMTAVANRTLGEPPTRAQTVGAAVIFAGALLYFSGDLGFTAVGMVAAVVALASNSTATLLGRSVNRGTGLPAEVVTVVSMGGGAAVLLGTGIVVEGAPRLTGTGWLFVGGLAVVNTALAFSWWNWSLRHLSAPASAGIINTMLIQIALLAWVFLGEVPGPVQWVGMAAVTVGVALAQRRAVAVSRA